MYIFGGSGNGSGRYVHIDNCPWSFNIKMPETLVLQPDKWLLSLAELRIQREAHTEGYFALSVDIVHPQPFYGYAKPVVRTFSLEPRESGGAEVIDHFTFTDKYYVPIHTSRVDWIKVSLKSIDGNSERDIIKTCCVLHVKHK